MTLGPMPTTEDGDKRKRRKGGSTGSVIHVAFGANGGRIPGPNGNGTAGVPGPNGATAPSIPPPPAGPRPAQ